MAVVIRNVLRRGKKFFSYLDGWLIWAVLEVFGGSESHTEDMWPWGD